MAITTYAQLQAAAANWLVRTDLSARIPEFITLAEARLNRVLRSRLGEADVALTAVAGSRTVPLPSDFAEASALWLTRSNGRTALPFLDAALIGATSLQGEPAAWTIDGTSLAFDRPCDKAYALTLRMLRAFALSDAAPTNTLLASAPDVYLFATLCEAAPFLRDGELAATYEARLERAITELNGRDARAPRTLSTELPELIADRGAA
jgi:hypothetical protein